MSRERLAFVVRFSNQRKNNAGPGWEIDAADPAKDNHLFLVDHAPISADQALALAELADQAIGFPILAPAVRTQSSQYRDELVSQIEHAEAVAATLAAKRAALAEYDALEGVQCI